MTQFWLLDDPYSSDPAESHLVSSPISCARDPGHRRSGAPKLTSIKVANRPSDNFVWTWNNDILVSERVLQAFAQNGVSGFEAAPVEVVISKPTTQQPPTLFELVVTGWGGMASHASQLKVVYFCESCRQRKYSIAEPSRIIDPAAWDGSDLFMVWPLPRYRFASDRLADLIRENRFTGVRLIPAGDIRMKRGATLKPGPLTHWMPEQRARELAKRFDVL
jgi:hypothetical protein